tara:strand:+ start:44611 stop:46740 length:2130 start_codon:yes stop_codon:yes gene_type:complete
MPLDETIWGALEAADSDWRFVPVGRNKKPINADTGDNVAKWQSSGGYDIDQIKDLPSQYVWAVGLLTGPASGGVLAVDFDGPGSEEKFLQICGRDSCELPKSISWTSGKEERRQVAFRVADEWWDSLVNRKHYDGVLELRWANHQSVVAGHHPETEGYRWVEGCSPIDVEVADAPDWLLHPLLRTYQEATDNGEEMPGKAEIRDMERAIDALEFIPIEVWNDYDDWLKVGMAMKWANPEWLDLWIEYSRKSSKFNEKTCQRKWKSFKGGEIHLGTLFHYAKKGGWTSPDSIEVVRPTQVEVKVENADGTTTSVIRDQRYTEAIDEMLKAVVNNDDDKQMDKRAEIMSRWKQTNATIEAKLFNRFMQQQIGVKAKSKRLSLDLSRIQGLNYLVEGFLVDNDLNLFFGKAGSGKTTAALGAAFSSIRGTGFLDHTQPSAKRKTLFIASDSGAAPLKACLQDMGLIGIPETSEGGRKMFHVWAADEGQGQEKWVADLKGCIQLLSFVKEEGIGLVMIDSCKSICSGESADYTSNQWVTAMLTFMKEVLAPHCCLVLINHDGVARGAAAGAKAWAEIPSSVHEIQSIEEDGRPTDRRRWITLKNRIGGLRSFEYEMIDGQLGLCMGQERINNCLDKIVYCLMQAQCEEGLKYLTRKQLYERLCTTGDIKRKTLSNTLTLAVRAKEPEIEPVANVRGAYKLSQQSLETRQSLAS